MGSNIPVYREDLSSPSNQNQNVTFIDPENSYVTFATLGHIKKNDLNMYLLKW